MPTDLLKRKEVSSAAQPRARDFHPLTGHTLQFGGCQDDKIWGQARDWAGDADQVKASPPCQEAPCLAQAHRGTDGLWSIIG